MSDLQRVVKLGELLVERRDALADAEAKAAEISKEVLRLEREDLPNLMTELGLSEITLTSGKIITIKEDLDTRISEANRPAAFAWLLDHGFGGIIKTLLTIPFGKGDREAAEAVRDELKAEHPDYEISLDESVHPSTLKSFVKERMKDGEPVPADLFGVYVYSKVVIKG